MSIESGASEGASGRPGASSPAAFSQVHEWGLRALLAALNHLLEQDETARARLQPHAGRTLRLGVNGLAAGWTPPIDLKILDDGRLAAAGENPGHAPAVSMRLLLSTDAVFDFLGQGPTGLQRHLRIEGDVLLAAAIGELARSLRWDVAEDLSRLTGDVLAHRLVTGASAHLATLRDTGQRAGQSLARFLAVEDAALVLRGELADHANELSSLESRISSLERRGRQRG